jgi:hypothetical protein
MLNTLEQEWLDKQYIVMMAEENVTAALRRLSAIALHDTVGSSQKLHIDVCSLIPQSNVQTLQNCKVN